MGSLLDRVESNGSRSVAVDIVLDGRDGGIKRWSSPGSEGPPFRSKFSHEFNDIDGVSTWHDGGPADRHQTRSINTDARVHRSKRICFPSDGILSPDIPVFLQRSALSRCPTAAYVSVDRFLTYV